MIYTTDIIGYQWQIFVKAIALGILLGGCYDFVRILRTVIRFGKKLFIASDFIYCLWAAFLIFSFLLNENFGIPRFYIFFGAALGFFAWYLTMGKIDMFFAKKLRKVLRMVLTPLFKIFQKILKFVKKRMAKVKIICEKAIDKRKSLLKKKARWVYNILCLNISKAFSFCGGKAGKEPEEIENNSSYCLRGVSSLFTDFDAGKHQPKTK